MGNKDNINFVITHDVGHILACLYLGIEPNDLSLHSKLTELDGERTLEKFIATPSRTVRDLLDKVDWYLGGYVNCLVRYGDPLCMPVYTIKDIQSASLILGTLFDCRMLPSMYTTSGTKEDCVNSTLDFLIESMKVRFSTPQYTKTNEELSSLLKTRSSVPSDEILSIWQRVSIELNKK